MNAISSSRLYVSQSNIPNSGRGVFANINIRKGSLIEICPIIEVPEDDVANLNGSFLVTYFYYLGTNKKRLALALGYGSIYNHTYLPNARYVGKKQDRTIEFIALRSIKKGEEITVNYIQGNKKYHNPLWFEDKNA
jgi:uncharacterized protein